MVKNNRVYGVLAIGAYMANFNADLSGYPKSTTDNTIFGSDKALKYPMKWLWQTQGEKVLYIKSMKISSDKSGKDEEAPGKMQPRDLNERYAQLFGELDEKIPSGKVLGNLFNTADVMNFGATFAEKKQNLSITGAVQINQGFNKYGNANVIAQDILSPFRNSNEKSDEKLATSIGTKIMTDEAHYVYSFSVNPDNYKGFIGLADDFEGYTIQAYEKFKSAAKIATTAFNTNSKCGCENELAIFIELKESSKLYLANLDRYVSVTKANDQIEYDISQLGEILSHHLDEIASVEIYATPYRVQVNTGSLSCAVQSIY
jgi:CRISPR-associated protein Csh2